MPLWTSFLTFQSILSSHNLANIIAGLPVSGHKPSLDNLILIFYNFDTVTANKARAIYFYAPMGATVFCNICLFISTALKIVRHKKNTAQQLKSIDSRRHDDNKQWYVFFFIRLRNEIEKFFPFESYSIFLLIYK